MELAKIKILHGTWVVGKSAVLGAEIGKVTQVNTYGGSLDITYSVDIGKGEYAEFIKAAVIPLWVQPGDRVIHYNSKTGQHYVVEYLYFEDKDHAVVAYCYNYVTSQKAKINLAELTKNYIFYEETDN